jgi:hypothetical protein
VVCKPKALALAAIRTAIRADFIEVDFFGSYLREDPTSFIGQNDAMHILERDKIRARILELTTQIAELAKIIGRGKMPKEVENRLAELQVEREQAEKNLEAETKNVEVLHAVPSVFAGIREAMGEFETADSQATFDQLTDVSRNLNRQLEDADIRLKLLNLVPTAVKSMVMDLENYRYTIVLVSGDKSDWRDLTPYQAAFVSPS